MTQLHERVDLEPDVYRLRYESFSLGLHNPLIEPRVRALGDGLSNACREPWGYERVDTKEPFALNEKDSKGYGLALSMWLSGHTDPEVAARLNAEGYQVWGAYQKRLRGNEEPVYELKPFNSRTVAAIRTNVWYRQFAPGSPYGTVRYKDELCEGRHLWLCPYEDWFRIQLGSVDERASELSRAAMELIELASDWRDASALERAEATQMLVETIFYDPVEQRIVGVSIRQKYRDVLVSALAMRHPREGGSTSRRQGEPASRARKSEIALQLHTRSRFEVSR